MKKLLLIVLITLLVISLPIQEVKAQNLITEYDGIPLIIHGTQADSIIYPLHYQQMESMGVYGVITPGAFTGGPGGNYLDYFEDNNLKVIPSYLGGASGDPWIYGQIFVYTDAYYTVWEAEGTDPANGKTTLFYNQQYTTYFDEGGYEGRWTDGNTIPADTVLIFGPGYPQNATYAYSEDKINYTLEYRMKITQKSPPPLGYEDDVVCTLQVTNIDTQGTGFFEEIVREKQVKVSEFNGWNNWKEILISDTGYTLDGYQNPNDFLGITSVHEIANCVQFKVIWAGLNYLDLYVDKITVSDNKGRDLLNPLGQARVLILDQVETCYPDEPVVIGWYGLDEPPSIDSYEPFRVVDSIVADVSNNHLRLHAGFPTYNLSSTFSAWQFIDTFAFNKYKAIEFWLRAKPKNMRMNLYNINYLSQQGLSLSYRASQVKIISYSF